MYTKIMNDKAYLDRETDLFLNRYRAQVVDSPSRRRRTYMPTHLEDYRMDEHTAVEQYMRSHTEPLVTIEIPHSALDVIVENDVRYNEILQQFMSHSYRGDIGDSLRREHYLKRSNAGVRKAWDHYQLMLKLAWEGKDVG
jgi:hypothetical protein